MGSLFGGTQKSTTTSTPWAPQGAALQSAFNSAGDIYNSKKDTPFYQGDLYANMDPATASAIQNMLGYTNGQGAQSAAALTQGGTALMDPSAVMGSLGKYADMSSGDPTQGNIAAATAYANNPAIDGMIDAASRDVNRNLYENDLPGIDRAATGTGNLNSSRAGVASGIAQRGAQDQIGDISSTIRGNAFNNGLSLAESARNANMNAAGNAAGLYGSTFGQGAATLGAGNSMALNNGNAAISAGQLNQQDQQGQLDANYQQWQGQDTRASDLLNQYYGIIGANNWGGTQDTTQKTSGSILGSVLGLGSTIAGLGGFGGIGKSLGKIF